MIETQPGVHSLDLTKHLMEARLPLVCGGVVVWKSDVMAQPP